MKTYKSYLTITLSAVLSFVFFGCSHAPYSDSRSTYQDFAHKKNTREPAARQKLTANVDFQQPAIIDSFFTPPDASELSQRTRAAGSQMPFSKTDDPSLGHLPMVQHIGSAKPGTELNMIIFNLSDRDVAQALVNAQARGVTTTVIIDHQHYCNSYPEETSTCPPEKGSSAGPSPNTKVNPTKQALDMLKAGKVTVVASSPKFSITHVKSFSYVSDDNVKTLVVTSMNQTRFGSIIRDFGVVTTDEAAYNEYQSVFQIDLQNAKNSTKDEPTTLSDANLAWSPVNSDQKLVAVINAAPKNGVIEITVEEFMASATDMITALKTAADDRQVAVKILIPLCQDPSSGIQGENSENMDQLIAFTTGADKSANIDARGLRGPPTATNPYLHQKMILVRDGDAAKTPLLAYVGSINYSKNSLDEARELGIIFQADRGGPASQALQKIASNFVADWNGPGGKSEVDPHSKQAIKVTDKQTGLCQSH